MNIKRESGNGYYFDKVFFKNNDLLLMPDKVLNKRVIKIQYFFKMKVDYSLFAIRKQYKYKLIELVNLDHLASQQLFIYKSLSIIND